MNEFRIWITGHADGRCTFRIESTNASYETEFSVTAGWKAQLSRLQWKAGALLKEEDAFLTEVSNSLAREIFPSSSRHVWSSLLVGGESVLRFIYRGPTETSVLLPVELLSIEGTYLVDVPGLNVVREFAGVSEVETNSPEMPPGIRLLHVSWGTDLNLGLRPERAALQRVFPDSPLAFLFSPSLEALRSEIARFEPTVVHISSHGSFDTLGEQHDIYVSDTETLATATILSTLAISGVELIFLASCQSALVAAETAELRNVAASAEIAGFLFPVQTQTAQEMMTVFYQEIRVGRDTGTAIAAARSAYRQDVFSSFSLVHFRPYARHFLAFAAIENPKHDHTIVLQSSERAMIRLDDAIRTKQAVTLVAPAGFGAETLVDEWVQLQKRAGLAELTISSQGQISFRMEPGGSVHSIRITRFCDYVPNASDSPVILGALGDLEDAIELHSAENQAQVELVGLMAARVPLIKQAILRGSSSVNALQEVLIQNRLDGRVHDLSLEGRMLAESLIGLGGVSALTLDSAESLLDMEKNEIKRGQKSILDQRLALNLDGLFRLSPEVMCFADCLFPAWRPRNEKQLEKMAGLFAVIHKDHPLRSEDEVKETKGLLAWSTHLERWDIFHELLLIASRLFLEAGRSSELVPYLETATEKLTGVDRMMHLGNLSAHRLQAGDYEQGLREQRELREWFEQNTVGPDQTRNVLAARSQEMTCLINLGRAKEALFELPDILLKTQQWKKAPPNAEAHVLGIFGEAYRVEGEYAKCASYFSEALKSLEKNGVKGEEELKFLYALSTALLQGDDVYGAHAVFSVLEQKLGDGSQPDMLSNVYHMKGKLLSEIHHPDASKYLLKSLEMDLAAGNNESALVSLFTVAHHAQLDGDRAAARPFIPKLREFAAKSQNPKHREAVREIEEIISIRSGKAMVDGLRKAG